jgi:hypothetical protein
MEPIIPSRDGRPLSTREIGAKTSFHGSGVVNLSTEGAGRRDRVHIAPPRDGFEALPLVAVLPMEATRYPLSQKMIRPTDLCLPEFLKADTPVGILIYVCAEMSLDPAPIAAAKQRMPLSEVCSCPLGNLALRAIVYSDPEQLKSWPTEEVQLVAHPSTPGGEPTWPFFA